MKRWIQHFYQLNRLNWLMVWLLLCCSAVALLMLAMLGMAILGALGAQGASASDGGEGHHPHRIEMPRYGLLGAAMSAAISAMARSCEPVRRNPSAAKALSLSSRHTSPTKLRNVSRSDAIPSPMSCAYAALKAIHRQTQQVVAIKMILR